MLPKNPNNFNVENVRVCKLQGGGVMDTQLVAGHVLSRGTEGTIHKVQNAKVTQRTLVMR